MVLKKSFLLSVFLYVTLFIPSSHGATGTIDMTTRHQTIEGLGASVVWFLPTFISVARSKPEIYDLLFGELGLDIARLRNTYDYGDYADEQYMSLAAEIISQARARTGRPLKLMVSSWSPPWYLKSNRLLNGGNDATLAIDANDLDWPPYYYAYDRYAQWWYNSILHYTSLGMQPDYINMQNEPDFETTNWETCRLDPTENSTIAGYKQALQALYTKLNPMPNRPKILSPETATIWNAGDYIDQLSTTDKSNIYGWAHHIYGWNFGADPDNAIYWMESFASQYSDKPRFQTEFSDDDNVGSYEACMDLAVLMHNSLTAEEVSMYLYWQLTWTEGLGLVQISGSSWFINPIYYAFKHYSAFTDPNWQRVEASTNSYPNLRISAYVNPDNNELSAVIINTHATSAINLDLSFTGLAIVEGDIYRTTSSQNCAFIGNYSGTGTFTLPAYSITTLALKIVPSPYQILDISSTSGGSVIFPREGTYPYAHDSNANISAQPERFYHFTEWTGSAVTADKVSDPYDSNTTVLMDDDYSVVANFELDPPDVNAPSPDPMEWDVLPATAGSTSITMTAATAIDDSPPVEYQFECINDPSKSSSWQTDITYIAQNLTPSTEYSFRVKARDSYLTPNLTDWSSIESATTNSPSTQISQLGSWTSGLSHSKETGVDRALIFIAHAEHYGSINLNSVTYGGQPMTKIMEFSAGSDTKAYVTSFILNEAGVAAASGNTFVPSWNTTPDYTVSASAFFAGANQADLIGATDSNAISASTPKTIVTDPLATNIGDMVILGATCGNSGSYTVNNGFTEGVDQAFNFQATGVTGHKAATGADEIPSVTYAQSLNRQVLIGFVLKTAEIDYPPQAPTGLTAAAGNDTVALDWNDNAESDLAGYNVYRSITQGSGYGKINSSLVTDSNYVDNDVNNGTPYYYVVTAVDGGSNESGYSDEAYATPDFQTCEDVKAGGYGFVSDFTGDCYVDMNDLAVIAQYWLHDDCAGLGNCDGADLEPDGDVDLFDYSDFALDWLNCNNPQDSNCPANW